MIVWLLALLASSQVPYELLALVKAVKSFSVKSGTLREKQPLSYTEQFLFVLSFNVAPYLQLIKLVFLFNNLKIRH